MKKIYDSDITKILGIPRTNLQDWKNSDATNWRYKVYNFLKQQSKENLEVFTIALASNKNTSGQNTSGQNSDASEDTTENHPKA